jgi:hypothetical protein
MDQKLAKPPSQSTGGTHLSCKKHVDQGVGQPRNKQEGDPISKTTKAKSTGGMAHVVGQGLAKSRPYLNFNTTRLKKPKPSVVVHTYSLRSQRLRQEDHLSSLNSRPAGMTYQDSI